MAEWKVYEADTPQCTNCGMWMPFAIRAWWVEDSQTCTAVVRER